MNLCEFIENNRVSYYDQTNNRELFKDNPREFIIRVLEYSDKEWIGEGPNDYRYYHSAMIYILGLAIYKNIPELHRRVNTFLDNDSELEFLYSWFMTTFIHDMGYGVVTSKSPRMWGLNNITEIENKTYEILRSNIADGFDAVPEEIKNNYIQYKEFRKWRNDRCNEIEYIDHGHFSSAVFLEGRESKFRNKLKNNRLVPHGNGQYLDIDRNLTWDENVLYDNQKKVCEVIAGHNVFFQRPYTNYGRVYRCLGLSGLLTKSPVFSFKEYPFYFLMQLVDTVDIFKHFSGFKEAKNKEEYQAVYKYILEQIDFKFYDDGLSIDFCYIDDSFIRKFWSKLRRERYWLPIEVRKKKSVVTIIFQ